jgi:serine/threonine-protein kinase HipA
MNAHSTKQPAAIAETIKLAALLDGILVGHVYQDRTGRIRFKYVEAWRDRQDGYPISLSMPLVKQEHSHEVTTAFLWGLLPDNTRTLDHYGRLFGVSSSNPIALLAHIGADCAGAVQFIPPENIDALISTSSRSGKVDWLSTEDVARELRTVREHGIPGDNRRTAGQFSLAGAQPKIALLEESGRWGRPSGRIPTNRILKPPTKEFAGFAENEHFCLELANIIGIGAVRSRVERFGGEIAIVVDRFDRQKLEHIYERIHQEDICQALGIMPTRKYQNEGGPGIVEIVTLLRDYSQKPDEDLRRFLSAISLGWVIAATDAHAKNYALLLGPAGATRLAPFYDISSYLPYASPRLHRVKLAMRVGSQYSVRHIGRRHWEALAKSIGVPGTELLGLVDSVVTAVLSNVDQVRQSTKAEGLDPSFIDGLAEGIRNRAQECLTAIRSAPKVGTA